MHLRGALDDQLLECADVIGSSTSKALLMLRDSTDQKTSDQATARGIGVVPTLGEALDVIERLDEIASSKHGLARLSNWFSLAKDPPPPLPMNPRELHPLPPVDDGA